MLCALVFWTKAAAMGPFDADSLSMAVAEMRSVQPMEPSPEASIVQENHRAVAIGLAVLLGPFGAHRLYLGTTPKVAIAYGLTLGGFGVVALIDLVHLIVVKDLDRFRNNDRILMWAGEPTPP